MIEHEHKHYSKRNIDLNDHIPQDEEILGVFKDRKKTPWKGWGNKFTNSLTVTNNYVIYTYLIKWYSWPSDNGSSQYVVDRIPIKNITKVGHQQKSK